MALRTRRRPFEQAGSDKPKPSRVADVPSRCQKQWPLYWSEDESGEFCASLAASPEAGVVVKDSGRIRKVRSKRQGTGKSGGVRVIYFVRNEAEELVLLTLCAKSETDNIKGAVLKEIRRALEA